MTFSSKSERSTVDLAREQEVLALSAGGKCRRNAVEVRPLLGSVSELSWGGQREALSVHENFRNTYIQAR